MRDEHKTLQLIKYVFWGTGEPVANEDVFNDLREHSLVALPGNLLPSLGLSEKLADQWKEAIIQQVVFYYRYKEMEAGLPLSVPYAIIKGSASAQYYPYPELRAMGDIDIITKYGYFQTACEELLRNGYTEKKSDSSIHREFINDNIIVEVHKTFSTLDDIDKSNRINELIFNGIDSTHYLPDLVNGIVMLEHIRRHLRIGLGLRQIIDWMLFANKCLKDDKWHEFLYLLNGTGLKKLAIVTTRTCEMYLGLPKHEWCQNADEKICQKFMKLILDSGNFGKGIEHDSYISSLFFTKARTITGFFRFLQARGKKNLENRHKWGVISSFAWLYQLWKYFLKGILRKKAFSKLLSEYRLGKSRNSVIDTLLEETTEND